MPGAIVNKLNVYMSGESVVRAFQSVETRLSEGKGHSTPKRRPEILVVDDDFVIRALLIMHLEREGYVVHVAEDAVDAGKLLLGDNPPDLLLVDIHMPFLRGDEFVKLIRSEESLGKLKIIVMTQDRSEDLYVSMKRLGVSEILSKPYDSDELLKVIATALDQ